MEDYMLETLKDLVDAISTMAPEVWDITLRHTTYTIIVTTCIQVTVGVILLLLGRKISVDLPDEGIEYVLFLVALVCFIFAAANIPNVLVPEWKTIENLIQLLT